MTVFESQWLASATVQGCRVRVSAGISQQVLVCTRPVCAYLSPSRRAVQDVRRGPPGHVACRPQAWCPGNSGGSCVRDIALWQGSGAFLERLDEAAVPHRVG